jgi:hypothetical protein
MSCDLGHTTLSGPLVAVHNQSSEVRLQKSINKNRIAQVFMAPSCDTDGASSEIIPG